MNAGTPLSGTPGTLPSEPLHRAHGAGPASPWIARFAPLIPAGSSVLDLASGAGRHTRLFAERQCCVTAVDRDERALGGLDTLAEVVVADLESGPWPFAQRQFDAVVVTHYLWRPLWPVLRHSVRAGGWLLMETFALGNARWGKPSNPQFLLEPGELLRELPGWHVLAYEDGLLEDPMRRIQRIAAQRPLDPAAPPDRVGDHPLSAHR